MPTRTSRLAEQRGGLCCVAHNYQVTEYEVGWEEVVQELAYEAWPGSTNPRRCSWNFEPIRVWIREHGEAVVLNRHWKRVTLSPLQAFRWG